MSRQMPGYPVCIGGAFKSLMTRSFVGQKSKGEAGIYAIAKTATAQIVASYEADQYRSLTNGYMRTRGDQKKLLGM